MTKKVDARDRLCPFRKCYWPCEWRGNIIPGQGYQYAAQDAWYWRCETRAQRGCPDPLPEPDPEKARCCHAPRVRKSKGRPPKRQRCMTCGKWLTGWPLEVAQRDGFEHIYPL